jgi:hypothetical protein
MRGYRPVDIREYSGIIAARETVTGQEPRQLALFGDDSE